MCSNIVVNMTQSSSSFVFLPKFVACEYLDQYWKEAYDFMVFIYNNKGSDEEILCQRGTHNSIQFNEHLFKLPRLSAHRMLSLNTSD